MCQVFKDPTVILLQNNAWDKQKLESVFRVLFTANQLPPVIIHFSYFFFSLLSSSSLLLYDYIFLPSSHTEGRPLQTSSKYRWAWRNKLERTSYLGESNPRHTTSRNCMKWLVSAAVDNHWVASDHVTASQMDSPYIKRNAKSVLARRCNETCSIKYHIEYILASRNYVWRSKRNIENNSSRAR